VPETGQEVLRLKGLEKRYGEKLLFSGLDALIEKGERVFLLGANGCGKTTLLNILRRKVKPDAGYVSLGANVRLGSYEQALAANKSGKTVLDEVWDSFRSLTQTELRSLLGAFLFPGDEAFKEMDCLSGGERARVALLKLMLSGANTLLLDEPTNHLDIASREALEQALLQFGGSILAVSHDRYFINRLATRVLRLHPGGLEDCGASYEDYLLHSAGTAPPGLPKRAKRENEYQLQKERAAAVRRRQTALTRCEAEIARLEEELQVLHGQLALPELSADYEAVLAHTAQLESRQTALEEQLALWEALSAEE
jgi:ATP-binding cassette subfamily F protein 3